MLMTRSRLIPLLACWATVKYLDRIGRYRNHTATDVANVASPGDKVAVCEPYGILRFDVDLRTSKCFSVANADGPWTPCSCEPMSFATPDDLANRLEGRGGFSIPGKALIGDLEASSPRSGPHPVDRAGHQGDPDLVFLTFQRRPAKRAAKR